MACLMCVEIQNDRITKREVDKALSEFVVPEEHVEEFKKLIEEKYGSDVNSPWILENE